MNLWQTEIQLKKPPFSLEQGASFYLIGSCFSDHIKKSLMENLFKVTPSPYGIEYNPISMSLGLNRILSQNEFHGQEVISSSNGFTTWHHHSQFNAPSSQELLDKINDQLKNSLDSINKCDCLCITFGTAFYYYLKDSQTVVNNCHKIPPNNFLRKSASISEIIAALAPCLEKIKSNNNKIKFIFTLSPVKHLRDDPTENSYSKALCRCAIEELMQLFKDNSYYFPAYEIMTDELRDYRFYDASMTHPSQEAVQFIITKFFETLLTQQGKEFLKEWEPILKFFHHKSSAQNLKSYQSAILIQNNKILTLKNKYPLLPWETFSVKF